MMRAPAFVSLALLAGPALGQGAPPDVIDEVIVRGRAAPQLRFEIERLAELREALGGRIGKRP
jgi:hypothetical protein